MSANDGSAISSNVAQRPRWAGVWLSAALILLVAALWLTWQSRRQLDALLHRFESRTVEQAAKVLDQLVTEQRKHLPALVGVLADDARIRAMVLTPTFDQATVLDLLTDLKATSGATMLAVLDSAGTVRAVVGAPEMDQLGLGTSSLVRDALEKPSAQLWAFGNEVGVLSTAAVRLDGQVRALFMMGFAMDDAVLESIQRTLGVTGAVFVGDGIVASATQDPAMTELLRTAAGVQPGTYRRLAGAYVASSSALSDSAVAAKAAWIVPLAGDADQVKLTRGLSWLLAALAGLGLSLVLGLALRKSRPGPSLGS